VEALGDPGRLNPAGAWRRLCDARIDMRLLSHYSAANSEALEATMPLTREQMDRKMDEHFGYEQADNVEGVLATLTADVEHDIVGWPAGPTRGPEGARGFYEALFADLADGRIETLRRLYGDGFMVDDSYWRGRAPGCPFGLEGRGRPLEFRLLRVVEFDDGGDIKRENVWVDLASIIQQLPQD
jgi:uncharacterized protein